MGQCHLLCGVKTNIVTVVEVTATETADFSVPGPLRPSHGTEFRHAGSVGGQSLLEQEKPSGSPSGRRDGLRPNQEQLGRLQPQGEVRPFVEQDVPLLQSPPKRVFDPLPQAVERGTTFSMIKAKFGLSGRSETPVAQANEVLTKVLCHNVVVLIQSVYELGIAPVFDSESFGTETAAAPKMA